MLVAGAYVADNQLHVAAVHSEPHLCTMCGLGAVLGCLPRKHMLSFFICFVDICICLRVACTILCAAIGISTNRIAVFSPFQSPHVDCLSMAWAGGVTLLLAFAAAPGAVELDTAVWLALGIGGATGHSLGYWEWGAGAAGSWGGSCCHASRCIIMWCPLSFRPTLRQLLYRLRGHAFTLDAFVAKQSHLPL